MSDDFIFQEDPRPQRSNRPFLIISMALLSSLIVFSMAVIGLLMLKPFGDTTSIAAQDSTPEPVQTPTMPPTPAPPPTDTATPLPSPTPLPTEAPSTRPAGALNIIGYDDVQIVTATAEPTQRTGPLRIITYGDPPTP